MSIDKIIQLKTDKNIFDIFDSISSEYRNTCNYYETKNVFLNKNTFEKVKNMSIKDIFNKCAFIERRYYNNDITEKCSYRIGSQYGSNIKDIILKDISINNYKLITTIRSRVDYYDIIINNILFNLIIYDTDHGLYLKIKSKRPIDELMLKDKLIQMNSVIHDNGNIVQYSSDIYLEQKIISNIVSDEFKNNLAYNTFKYALNY